jgi:hypothetical protein
MRSLPAALAVIGLLALAGCGGSSSKTTATTATVASGPGLTETQLARLDSASKQLVSSITLFQVKLNRCASSSGRSACVQSAVRRAAKVLTRTRKAIAPLAAAKTGANCKANLGGVTEQLSSLTEDLNSLAAVVQQGDAAGATRLGSNAQASLRAFAGASTVAQQSCLA